MTRRAGFTLVELLVVIAIIAILAGIAVPKVSQHLKKSKVTRALADTKGIELAFTTLLADAQRSNIWELFVDDGQTLGFKTIWRGWVKKACDDNNPDELFQAFSVMEKLYTETAYKLLRSGKNFESTAEIVLRDDVRKKLAASYLDLGLDPWQNKYRFLFGSPKWPTTRELYAYRNRVYLRSFRGVDVDGNDYRYTLKNKDEADKVLPGNPPYDDLFGFPAPTDLPVYVLSTGEDGVYNQGGLPTTASSREVGGGDDVNNWDGTQGWTEATE